MQLHTFFFSVFLSCYSVRFIYNHLYICIQLPGAPCKAPSATDNPAGQDGDARAVQKLFAERRRRSGRGAFQTSVQRGTAASRRLRVLFGLQNPPKKTHKIQASFVLALVKMLPHEQCICLRCLPNKDDFHFCVVSARRAGKVEGVKDIFTVQTQLLEAEVTPTWYVDEDSLEEYRSLGLKAVVGGKLTPARNKALDDANKAHKICVQMSDDISGWEYRDGPRASSRDDRELNEAWAQARRLLVSPVTAARFIVAKMRAAPEKPKLGGGTPSQTVRNIHNKSDLVSL